MLRTCWASVGKFLSADQKSSMQVLESSNDQDHADGNVECRGIDASGENIGDDSNYLFKCSMRVTWCSTSRDSLTGCIPEDWSCQCP
jgi:hypothetical protein